MFVLRKFAARITAHPSIAKGVLDRSLDKWPPPEDALQQALLYLNSRLRLARRCGNPKCKHLPYFLKDKPNQKYCSEGCFEVIRQESKTQWWIETGYQRRDLKRAASQKGKKHAKG